MFFSEIHTQVETNQCHFGREDMKLKTSAELPCDHVPCVIICIDCTGFVSFFINHKINMPL